MYCSWWPRQSVTAAVRVWRHWQPSWDPTCLHVSNCCSCTGVKLIRSSSSYSENMTLGDHCPDHSAVMATVCTQCASQWFSRQYIVQGYVMYLHCPWEKWHWYLSGFLSLLWFHFMYSSLSSIHGRRHNTKLHGFKMYLVRSADWCWCK